MRLLQARPITTLFTWTDWELEHEFDTGCSTDHEVNTRGNVGEVLPGALTPLTLSTVVKCLDLGLAQQAGEKTGPGFYISHTTSWVSVINHQVRPELYSELGNNIFFPPGFPQVPGFSPQIPGAGTVGGH